MSRVLIVDDSRTMRMIITRTLRQAGFNPDIVEADSGQAALELARTGSFDAILSDWNMPGLNGLELLRALRAESIRVPFLFVTSESTTQMMELAASEGALAMIRKPFTGEDFALLARYL